MWAFLENETSYLKGSWFHHDFGRIKYHSHEYLIYLIHIHRKGLHFSQCRITGLLSAFCVELSILSLKCILAFQINLWLNCLPLHWVLPFEKTGTFETHLTELPRTLERFLNDIYVKIQNSAQEFYILLSKIKWYLLYCL